VRGQSKFILDVSSLTQHRIDVHSMAVLKGSSLIEAMSLRLPFS